VKIVGATSAAAADHDDDGDGDGDDNELPYDGCNVRVRKEGHLQWRVDVLNRPVDKLGEGQEGVVFRAKYYREAVAVKQIPAVFRAEGSEGEWTKLAQLHHSNVVRYKGKLRARESVLLILELCDYDLGHALQHHVLPPQAQVDLCRQLFEGVAYLHKNRVAHRDLKPSNILLQKQKASAGFSLKLSDFGNSKRHTHTLSARHLPTQPFGTRGFIAPEVIQGREVDNFKADCFGVGLLVHIILTRRHPFDEDAEDAPVSLASGLQFQREMNITEGKASISDSIDPHAQQLVQQLLAFEPEDRPKVQLCCDSPFVLKRPDTHSLFALVLVDTVEFLSGAFAGRKTGGQQQQQQQQSSKKKNNNKKNGGGGGRGRAEAGEGGGDEEDGRGRGGEGGEEGGGAGGGGEGGNGGGEGAGVVGSGEDNAKEKERLAWKLEELLLPHLPAHWPSVVDRPDSGTWLTAPTNTFNYWKGKGLLAFGLLKWLRNLFAHAGQIVGRGSFASRADINAYVENRFKWLPHKLAEFQLSDLPKLVIVHADKAVPDAHHADVDYPRRAVLGRE
jgi:serine/threonine protein kinase